jgi:hypothetical protein
MAQFTIKQERQNKTVKDNLDAHQYAKSKGAGI